MRILFVPTLLALAACQPTPPAAPPTDSPKTAAACAAAGGTWQRAGMMGIEQCIFTYADAGKVCSDGKDCLGDCRATETTGSVTPAIGQCQATTSPFGCHGTIENGQVTAAICVD